MSDVFLSAQTMEKQKSRHPDLVPADYAVVPALIADPAAILKQDANHLLLLRRSGHIWVGVVKATRARDANYPQSLFRARPRNVRLLLSHHAVVFGRPEELGLT